MDRQHNGNSQKDKQRSTDNTMAKWQLPNGQPTIHKTLHRKLKIDQYQPL